MASFDPSIISQIPDMAGNPLEARAKGYKLADLITEQQRNKLLLSGQQEQQQEQQKAKSILQNFKGDIGTAEGNADLARQYQKAGLTKQSMESLQLGSEQQVRDLQKKEMELKILDMHVNMVGPAALQVKKTLDEHGLAAAQAQYAQLMPTMPKELSAKWPQQLPNDPQQAGQLLDQGWMISEKARKLASEWRAEKKDVRDEKRLDLAEARESRAEKQQADRASGVMDEGDLRFAARQYLAGDKSVFQNMGRGTQGGKNIVAMRHAIRQEAEAQGLQPQDVATKIAEFGGLMAEERAVGTRQAAIETAATEASKMIPIALKASEEVPRGQFRPVNQLIQKGQIMTSDPKLARFAQANLTLANIYARAVNPTGVPTDSARDHALSILSIAQSQESYAGVVDIMKREIEAARSSPPQVREDIRASVAGQYKAPAPGPVAGGATGGSAQNDPLGIR